MYIDAEFYYNMYNGEATDGVGFPRYNALATMAVDRYTFNRITDLEDLRVKYAVCELIDLYILHEQKKLKANSAEARVSEETTGSHTVTFKYEDEIQKPADLGDWLKRSEYEIVAKYLIGSGLMYRGIP